MNRHASMNRVYRLIWSAVRGIWIPVAEKTRGRGKQASRTLIAAAMSLGATLAQAGGPAGGQVIAGSGSIAQSAAVTTITQQSATLSLTWTSFNIAPQQTVDFVQPSASAIAVNRIFDTNGTQILGHLNANGQVFLINPNGILFGPGAQVNVGGLVASTLDLNQSSVDGASRSFSGDSTASVVNQGTITAAPGGYVALLGNHVDNRGVISAQLGTVALAAGSAATLTFSDNSLLRLQVDQSVWRSVAQNGGLIRADGGQVIMTAGAKDALLASVVNNSGVIEARTVGTHDGNITLLAGMAGGTVDVGGTIDASAPDGGNGGFIETSAAHVQVASDARVTTAAAMGLYGSWLIDPQDFTIAPSGGTITGAALSNELATTPVLVASSAGQTAGSGNINVNDAVAWSANTLLTLTASNNVNVNANITATGNSAGLVINPGTANGGEAANGGGTYTLQSGASITLSGATPSLSIAGNAYTVINTLGAAGSTTGNDLQGINGRLGGYYALGSNIDATLTQGWNAGAGFTPIGNNASAFTGTFDGLGHTIANLTSHQGSANYVGLFGVTGGTGVIKNLGLVEASVTGGSYVGALVGRNNGSVADSFSTGVITGYAPYNIFSGSGRDTGGLVGNNYGSITGSHSGAVVNGQYSVGGVAGRTSGTITNSYATGAITGGSYVGGLVGEFFGSGSDLYATGAVNGTASYARAGGLVGDNNGTISNSYASGSVTSGRYAGGLIGVNYGTVTNSYATGATNGSTAGGLTAFQDQGTIINSYSTGAVSGGGAMGGLVGAGYLSSITNSYWNTTTTGQTGSYGGGTGLTTTQMQAASNFTGFIFTATPGAAGNNWVMVDVDGSLNNAGGVAGATFPMLASEYSTSIVNAHQLQLMAMALSASYTLAADIDASATTLASSAGSSDVWSTSGGFVPIGSHSANFTGSFNGQGNTISNLTVNWPTTNDVGLFGVVGSAGVIESLGLLQGSVAGGQYYVGGLAGRNYGTVDNSSTSGNVSGALNSGGGLVGANNGSITNSHASGNVTTPDNAGGLVALNYGSVSNSYATGAVSGAYDIGGLIGYSPAGSGSNVYATGAVTGTANVGGLVGLSHATFSNSYATGSTQASGASAAGLVGNNYGTITDSYATGAANGASSVGGLVGANNGGTISSSHATGNVSGGDKSGGLVGSNSGSISASYGSGTVTGANNVGGLVGANYGPVSNSYATGAVTGTGNNVGGLAGANYGAISGSHATGQVSGGNYVGGLIGSSTTGAISNSYATGNVSGNDRVGGLIGQNYGNPYQNPGYGAISNSYATGAVTANVLAGGLVGFNNSGTISNSYATGSVSAGGYVGGLVGTNFGTITGSFATGTVSAGGGNNAGGLVGRDGGAIDSSYATGAVSGGSYVGGLLGEAATQGVLPITNSYATGSVTGDSNVGGLIGYNAFAVSNSYATGAVIGTTAVGGLVGSNYGTITNTYASGHVQGSSESGGLVGFNYGSGTISNSYATGGGAGGGLVGDNEGSVTDSFWNSDITAIGIAAGTTTGAAGLNSAGMMTMANFSSAGWSIADVGGSGLVWRIYPGSTAPLLLSFMTSLTVTADNVGVTYGDTPIANLSNVSYSLSGAATSGHLFNLNNAYSGSINVGSYAPSLYSDQQGYDISYVNASLTVTPATLTVTANGASRVYGQANPVLTGSITGFVGSDTLVNATTGTESFSTAATLGSNVGSYAINASGLTANTGNYVFSYASGNATAFQITPATLTVTANGASRIYGQANPTLTGSIAGFVGSDTLANATTGTEDFVPAASPGSIVGSYAINASGLSANNGNYVFSYAPGNATAFQITPATLTYTATAASIVSGQTPTGLSGTLSGFVLTDSQGNATTGTLTWSTSASAGSAPGHYAIDGGGLTATNYVFVEAAENASALTVAAGSSPVLPPVLPPASGPDAAALDLAQTAASTLEANLPASQTTITPPAPTLALDIVQGQGPDAGPGATSAVVASDGIEMDKRVVIEAVLPSLRIVRGGVRLPDNLVDVNAR